MPTYLFDDHLNHFAAVLIACWVFVVICLLKYRIEVKERTEEQARLREAIERIQALSRPMEVPTVLPVRPRTSRRTRLAVVLSVGGLASAAVADALATPTHLAAPYAYVLLGAALLQGACGAVLVLAPPRRMLARAGCAAVAVVGAWLVARSVALPDVSTTDATIHVAAGVIAVAAACATGLITARQATG